MKHLTNWLNAAFAAMVAISASAGAAPILSDADALNVSNPASVAVFAGAAGAPMFSHMGLNGGLSHTVAFVGDDNSILIGHYKRGVWSKNQFLQSWQNVGGAPNVGGGGGNLLPPAEAAVTGLPEPATFALFAVGLFALALATLRRRRTSR